MTDLEKIAKKLERIEDKDPNFKTNKTWIKLKTKQDLFYRTLEIQDCRNKSMVINERYK